MIFLVLSGKMIFLLPENMILFSRRKMKDGRSQKIHGNIFRSDVLKRWSFQKIVPEYDLSRTIRKDGISFSRKCDLFSMGGK